VAKISIKGDSQGLSATGVELEDGTQIGARRVISSADPKRTFLQLVGAKYLEIEFTNRINRLRCDGYVGKLHLALDAVPNFTGIDIPDGRMIIAPEMDSIEFAFDDAKYGESPKQPVMEIVLPSFADPSLAPEGKHVLSAHVMYVPHSLKGGWTDQARDQLRELVIDSIAKYAPDIRRQIVHAELLTPADLERDYHVTGGHWHHTELSMDQMLMMRPTYEAAQYSTPIPGLYLCGAGSHPGGGLMGGPGHNAAQHILGAK
jgi:phytoene dehydrogenase-like protein